MLAEERRGLIVQILGEKGSVSVAELYRRFHVSRETIRRDISRLAAENLLKKTHGGALSVETEEPAFADRMSVNTKGKNAIGRLAATLVPDGASVIIDSGTTTICLARALAQRRRLTVYTNDIQVAGRLAGRNENRVLLLGGEMQGADGATLGRDATEMLANYFADFVFIGVSALTSGAQLLDFSREAAELRSRMLAQGRTKVLLADHTKFNRLAPVRVAHLDQVSFLITDRHPKEALKEELDRLTAEIMIAGDEKT